MSKYKSNPIKINRPAAEIADKFNDLTKLQSLVENLPDDQKEKLKDIQFESDTITLKTAQLGDIMFKKVEQNPGNVKFSAIGAPVPVGFEVKLDQVDAENTNVSSELDIELPMMLKPMVGPYVQKAIDMLGDVIGHVAAR